MHYATKLHHIFIFSKPNAKIGISLSLFREFPYKPMIQFVNFALSIKCINPLNKFYVKRIKQIKYKQYQKSIRNTVDAGACITYGTRRRFVFRA